MATVNHHDWKAMYVDTNMRFIGDKLILKFVDKDGSTNTYYLDKNGAKWLRRALKSGMKLSRMPPTE